MALPPPLIEEHDGFLVVRDDIVPGGAKRRVLGEALKDLEATEFVYPGTAYGFGALALAYAARDLDKSAHLFYAARNRENWTPTMLEAVEQGAAITLIPNGRMNVVNARAREYAAVTPGAHYLRPGFNSEGFREAFTRVAKALPVQPAEVWCATGSGTITNCLQKAWPDAEHHAVLVARKNVDIGNAVRHIIRIPFEQAAKVMPPFPSAANYDAKAWAVMKRHARPGALFWNVGG